MNICSIIARNYLAHARVLAESFRIHHPDGRCVVLVIDDELGSLDTDGEPFEVIRPSDLGVASFDEMRALYTVLELSTALKPWLLQHMLAHYDDGHGVAYFDPDIEIHSRMVELESALQGHSVVLTPHLLAPLARDGHRPSETDILLAGVYNLGFIGVSDRPGAHLVLDWWAERLKRDCIVAPERGYFVDQRWIDFVPGLIDDLKVLRHPGYNVAYWNVLERDVNLHDGTYRVGDAPLRFLHYSGFDIGQPSQLSRHQDRVNLADHAPLLAAWAAYAAALVRHGHADESAPLYAYDTLPSGLPFTGLLRMLYRQALERHAGVGSPFSPDGETALIEWAAGAADATGLNRFCMAAWAGRADLQAAFREVNSGNVERYCEWLSTGGFEQLQAPPLVRSLPRPAAPVAPSVTPAAAPPLLNGAAVPRVPVSIASNGSAAPLSAPAGVNVVGYLHAEVGVGEVARQVITALDAAAVINRPSSLLAPRSRQGHAFAAASRLEHPFAVNLVCVNADVLPAFAAEAGASFFAGKHTIGLWWWETDQFPADFAQAFDHVDEVWVGSRFIADALQPISPVPVIHMPVPITFPERAPLRPSVARWPADAFTFLFSWDYHSIFARKNPLAVVEAYTAAFNAEDGAALVLKCINSGGDPANHQLLLNAIADRPDIVVIDQYLDASDRDRLIASCDCYVSLHRSEGLGLTLAEALFHGRPVIATGYSGSLELTDPQTSLLVDYKLVPIGPGSAPYPADGRWAEPNVEQATRLMRDVFERPAWAASMARQAARDLRERYSPEVCGAAMRDRLAAIEAVRSREAALVIAEPPAAGLDEVHHLLSLDGRVRDRSRFGWPGNIARRIAHRVMRPHTFFQHEVNAAFGHGLDAVQAHTGELTQALRDNAARTELALAQTQALLDAQLRREQRFAEEPAGTPTLDE